MLGDGGLDFLVDLVEPIVLHSGDGPRLDEGGFVEVRGRNAAAFAPPRLASRQPSPAGAHRYAERILIRDDHVIIDMLKGLGAEVRKVRAPWRASPNGGRTCRPGC